MQVWALLLLVGSAASSQPPPVRAALEVLRGELQKGRAEREGVLDQYTNLNKLCASVKGGHLAAIRAASESIEALRADTERHLANATHLAEAAAKLDEDIGTARKDVKAASEVRHIEHSAYLKREHPVTEDIQKAESDSWRAYAALMNELKEQVDAAERDRDEKVSLMRQALRARADVEGELLGAKAAQALQKQQLDDAEATWHCEQRAQEFETQLRLQEAEVAAVEEAVGTLAKTQDLARVVAGLRAMRSWSPLAGIAERLEQLEATVMV